MARRPTKRRTETEQLNAYSSLFRMKRQHNNHRITPWRFLIFFFSRFLLLFPQCCDGFFPAVIRASSTSKQHRLLPWFSKRKTIVLRATNSSENDSSLSLPPQPYASDDASTTSAAILLLLQQRLSPPDGCDVDRMSSTDLAYIGDVLYEMFVRCKKVWPPKRTSDLQQQVVRLVRAEYQSAMLARLRNIDRQCTTTTKEAKDAPTFSLTVQEERVMNRGRNAGTKTNHRKSNPAAYQDATALEALLGYLYISDKARCAALLQWMDYHLDHIQY